MYAAYDDTEIGALDCEEIEGFIAPDNEMLLQFASEFEKEKKEPVRTRFDYQKTEITSGVANKFKH